MNFEKLVRPCVLDLKAYVPGKPMEEVKRELGLSDIIKLASNENPLGASPLAVAAMLREIQENVNYYPESLAHDLICALAERYGLAADQFVLNNGADGIITMLGMAFINPGEEAVMGELTFQAYSLITRKMDGRVVTVPLTADGRLDVDGMLAAVTERTKFVFLCNPNNPTGTMITRAEFDRLIRGLPESVLLVSDEAYYEFADDPEYPQTLPYLKEFPNLVILRTFSKVMGLAGVRIGYGMAHPEIIRLLLKVREPFPVNRIAQAGALASLADREFVKETLRVNRAGRAQLTAGMRALGLRCLNSQTNFIFVDLGRPAQPVYQELLCRGIIVRPLGPMGSPNALRITIGTPEQNQRLLEVLGEVIAVAA
ncbi:MAG TPA: histidinol-phosphate transaminase [Anaerolineaceae bacterium]|nr:histidinol-phosphate transaminase [Anaerolineaceae bacterium]